MDMQQQQPYAPMQSGSPMGGGAQFQSANQPPSVAPPMQMYEETRKEPSAPVGQPTYVQPSQPSQQPQPLQPLISTPEAGGVAGDMSSINNAINSVAAAVLQYRQNPHEQLNTIAKIKAVYIREQFGEELSSR